MNREPDEEGADDALPEAGNGGEAVEDAAEVEDKSAEITEPFDPTQIRIETKTLTVDLLVRRIKQGEIDLATQFQRMAGLWRDGAQSRLIESLLIRIPVPAFYVDATDEDRWLVVDGLQRLSVLKRFVIDQELRLTGLEFLTSYVGKRFSDLPRPMQRRIEETQVTVYLIQPGTPPTLKFNIFKRINTGGLPLSPQEIRHALNQGAAAEMLKRLAEHEAFQRVAGTSIRNQRMTDRECVLRFFAFSLMPPDQYKAQDLDGFLNEQMKALGTKSEEERRVLEHRFVRAMIAAHDLFGHDAFRKRYRPGAARKPINKALFETWSVNLDRLADADLAKLASRRDAVRTAFMELMNNRQDFVNAISQGTGDPAKVRLRFEAIGALIQGVLNAEAIAAD